MNEFSHYSVMLLPAVEGLSIRPGGLYVDCTAGSGGHSLEIAKRLTAGGHLIAIDQDPAAIAAAKERLRAYADRVTFVGNNFSELDTILQGEKIDGALIDLGVSSYQLDTPERGFSYRFDAPLDMRMDPHAAIDAYTVINTYSEAELSRILYEWGEERFAARIAQKIVAAREKSPIATTFEFVDVIKSALPPNAKDGPHHPAKRSFQAIRIEVNRELDRIEPTLRTIADALRPGGRVAAISFHSLEDRIVKQTFTALSKGCTCPPNFPVCVCGKKPVLRVVTRKPILPDAKELAENQRSHSAKLRIAEKL